MKLEDRVAIVTGGGFGIGRGIARRFAREGAQVVIAEIIPERARATVSLIEAEGGRAVAIDTDVRERAQVEAMVEQTVRAFGTIDILVNNAGLVEGASFVEMTDEQWHDVMATNLTGPFLCTQAVVREMIKLGHGGRIVNIASIESELACPNQAHYAASKGGVLMLTRALACDLAQYGIRVNAIGPGTVDSGHGAFDDPAMREKYGSRVPLGRVAVPEDIARAAVFLASDDAEYINGVILYVDGGTSIKYAGLEWPRA